MSEVPLYPCKLIKGPFASPMVSKDPIKDPLNLCKSTVYGRGVTLTQ